MEAGSGKKFVQSKFDEKMLFEIILNPFFFFFFCLILIFFYIYTHIHKR